MSDEQLRLLHLMVYQQGSGKWFDAMLRVIYPPEIFFFGGEFLTSYPNDVLDFAAIHPRGFWPLLTPFSALKLSPTEFLMDTVSTPGRPKSSRLVSEPIIAKEIEFPYIANTLVADYIRAYAKVCDDLQDPWLYKTSYDTLLERPSAAPTLDPLTSRSSSRTHSPRRPSASSRPYSARDSILSGRSSRRTGGADGLGARRRKCLLVALFLRRHGLTLLDLAARMAPTDARAAAGVRRFVLLHTEALRCVWGTADGDEHPAVVLPPPGLAVGTGSVWPTRRALAVIPVAHTASVWAAPHAASVWPRSEPLSVWSPGPFETTWATGPCDDA